MAKKTLNVGDVFLSITPKMSGDNPHYFIVVHKTDEDEIVVVNTTTEVDKVLRRCRQKEKIRFDYIEPETCIIINNNHCDSLSHESAIDCNKARKKPTTFFTSKQYFKNCSPIKDPTIIPKIIKAIKLSNVVEDKIINLL